MSADPRLAPIEAWFDAQGWSPFPYQREAWRRQLAGESGLVHAPTGFGKSLSVWMAALAAGLEDPRAHRRARRLADAPPLSVLWITPMRALAQDLGGALAKVAAELAPGWRVETRTGDSSSSARARQRKHLPTALVTTPESASLLLSYPDAPQRFAHLRLVVVDEWHELLGTKRGTQTELALARLRALAPGLRTWGLSATLGNLDQALEALLGVGGQGALVGTDQRRALEFRTLVPAEVQRFPWAGHMGLHQLDQVAAELDRVPSSLLFVNTRNQAERWFQALRYARFERQDELGLHHGSLDREQREAVERGVAEGRLWATVATSSLDLGVDFAPVEQVLQIGSPKGIARLAQRGGRSGHGPGRVSRVLGVPTHALELVEFVAARQAIAAGEYEPRAPLDRPLDVLLQHLVTVALGGGFREDELLAEVRGTRAFRDLSDEEWAWALEFCRNGGEALAAYERYARLRREGERWVAGSAAIAREHRISIGTIAGFGSLRVVLRNGRLLGSLEELFLSRLSPGERFTFAGRSLELVRVEADKAVVRPAKGSGGAVPKWLGGRMPLSNELSRRIRVVLGEVARGEPTEALESPELRALAPLFRVQAKTSRVPAEDELLIERTRTRDGDHAFLFPIAGRRVHEGLAALLAHRLTRQGPMTLSTTVSDWGLCLVSRTPLPEGDAAWRELLSPHDLLPDILACLDASGLARRHFREVARVAGLVNAGPPWRRKNQRQLQASAGLVYDVLAEHDPQNLLLAQTRSEVLERTLEVRRLAETLEDLAARSLHVTTPKRLSPLAFSLWADRTRERFSSESWEQRVAAMVERLERAAGQPKESAK